MNQRRGEHFDSRGKKYVRMRIGKGARFSVALPTCRTDEDAMARGAAVADVVNVLIAGGRRSLVELKEFARAVGAATSEKEIRVWRKAAERLVATGPRLFGDEETVKTFGTKWTSGELARSYPDHIKVKGSAKKDAGILAKYVYPIIGDLPVVAVRLEHAEAVMRAVPADFSGAWRRHVAQAMTKLFRFAVYPCRLITASPLPAGFLPKIGKPKALTYLYPDEDATLMACTSAPLVSRVYFGVLAREGLRADELFSIEWTDIDLVRGAVNLDKNKTNDPRSWALQPDVTAALTAFKKRPEAGQVRPFEQFDPRHGAEQFRDALLAAGITRSELFESSDVRRPINLIALRSTFITLSLATGRTETWVADRTGHRSTLMISRYRRAARKVEELGLGGLEPLDQLIPELGGQQVPSGGDGGKVLILQKPAVAPAGLEPARPSGPEILNAQPGRRGAGEAGKNRALGDPLPPRGKRGGHPGGHPFGKIVEAQAIERVTWDLYDVLAYEDWEEERRGKK